MTLGESVKSSLALAGRSADLLLVGMVAAVIALMVVPLPTFMVDLLISCNIALSFVILLMTMYVPGILAFSSFPSVLLFTTLFRVGLNIATTRLILLQADAGEIIYTFGEFAVGGNFVVGAVVFIIIAIIQFLVIAKGAERVSEVGARFSLDAMPGKQMSIDADLRAGAIDADEAQRRRNEVALESQMFGAMDGAMKFVKGDAVAGLLIAAVNICAGTIIGVTGSGLTAGESLRLYGVLTIGDGLVSQIPSLLIAISAGVLVTRGGERSDNLGSKIGSQISSRPRALLIAGALIFLFALIPGFPKIQLFAIAALLIAAGGGLGFFFRKDAAPNTAQDLKSVMASAVGGSEKTDSSDGDGFAPVVPLILDLSEHLSESLDYDRLKASIGSLRRSLYFELGVPFPGVSLRKSAGLRNFEYVINLDEIPAATGELMPDLLLVREDAANLAMLNVSVTQGRAFMSAENTNWIDANDARRIEKVGIHALSHEECITLHLSMIMTRHAHEFIGMQESRFLLDRMEERYPELVREATRLLPLQRISDLLKRLVQEQVSIRDLRGVLEAVIVWAPKEKDQVMLCEYVRGALKRQISFRHCASSNMLPAVLLDPEWEEKIRQSIRQTSAGAFLSLDPKSVKMFTDEVRRIAGQKRRRKFVIICSMDIRRYVRRLIETDFYTIPVLDYQELVPEVSVQPVDRIRAL